MDKPDNKKPPLTWEMLTSGDIKGYTDAELAAGLEALVANMFDSEDSHQEFVRENKETFRRRASGRGRKGEK